MIPKIIHYIWVGGKPLPKLAQKCIASWKKNCPDYEIKRWDETNFNFSINKYCKDAYDNKKWAFVSDYIRLKVLHDYGGIYMDTDVEVKKNIYKFLKHKAFSGYESSGNIPTGIMASEKNGLWVTELLKDYDTKQFIKDDGSFNLETNVIQITNTTKRLYPSVVLNNTLTDLGDVTFYPSEYFCPIEFSTGKKHLTQNTYTIHWFNGSWLPKKVKIKQKIKVFLNKITFGLLYKIYTKIKNKKQNKGE